MHKRAFRFGDVPFYLVIAVLVVFVLIGDMVIYLLGGTGRSYSYRTDGFSGVGH